ncbi:1 3-beta-glucanosyltransferase gel4 [Tieghemiomyces parasiticus]|uniref:1,3-beta-glucanosyltransferase n=1 Tax=Tieghemiomyces parasiticus TaxID=78921 RepID=A0A9W7ZR92_9FUNG|nr:1 3-beta-glucanosyltransferase gel4 [Tieghemiomyces parasiticus]
MSLRRLVCALLLTALPLGLVGALTAVNNRLTIRGNRFFSTQSKKPYFIKGIIYQPNVTTEQAIPDPLADPTACERDIPYLQDLGVNSIRVPITDNDQDHDDCMKQFADANINVFLDLKSVNASQPMYDTTIMTDFMKKISAFRKYPNFVAVFAGNEVVTNNKTTNSAAFVKALVRDVKAYVTAQNLRIYVGYSNHDDAITRDLMMQYLNCGGVKDQVDFLGINLHGWCGDDVDFKSSGFESATTNMTKLSIPAVLGEFGCRDERPQSYGEVASLFGKDMINTFSGGFASEYSSNTEDYGLVNITSSSSVNTFKEYKNLKSQYSDADEAIGAVKGNLDSQDDVRKAMSCPRVNADWQSATLLPPKPSDAACSCVTNAFTCALNFGSENTDLDILNRTRTKMCPPTKCLEIFSDPANGVYGTYSMCPYEVQMGYMLNQNYTKTTDANSQKCQFKSIDVSLVKKPKVEDIRTCSSLRTTFQQEADASASAAAEDDSSTAAILIENPSWKGWAAMAVPLVFATLIL